jgi:hypothetical protein
MPATRAPLDLRQPRSVAAIVTDALELYARHPLVFTVLALSVVAPYELLVFAVTGTSPLGAPKGALSTTLVLDLLDLSLVLPLISALHVQAVVRIGEGRQPRLSDVVSSTIRVLPPVAAATIAAGLGTATGFVAFVIPGLILLVVWSIVAQVAAVERSDWPSTLRRSAELTRGHYFHIFGLLVLLGVIEQLFRLAAGQLAGTGARPSQLAVGIAIETVTRSFAALATALLFFDLLARQGTAGSGAAGSGAG